MIRYKKKVLFNNVNPMVSIELRPLNRLNKSILSPFGWLTWHNHECSDLWWNYSKTTSSRHPLLTPL